MEIKYGSTRTVFLIGKYAFKIPSTVEYRLFLQGLLANMQECLFWRELKHPKLCPVFFAIPLGLLVVMPRVELLGRIEFENFDYETFIDATDWVIPVENKLDSFGILNDKIVAIDYGT